MPKYTTQRSGNWPDSTASSPWYTGTTPAPIPGAGDTVTIATGHTVTIPDGYNAVVGNSPSSAGVVLTVNGTGSLTIGGGGASGSLRVLGSALYSDTASALTVNAGGTLFLDGSGNIGQRYTLGIGALTAVRFNGTSAAHVTVKSTTAGGATPAVVGPGDGSWTGGVVASYTDFQYLGDSTTQGWKTDMNQNFGGAASDFQFRLDDCTLDHCGEFWGGSANTCSGSRFEVNNCASTNTRTDGSSFWALNLNPNAPLSGGGTYTLTGTRLDGGVHGNSSGLTCTGNIFGNAIAVGGSPFALFDNNTVRLTDATTSGGGCSFPGSVTNCFLYYDSPGSINPHFVTCPSSALGAARYDYSGNVAYFNGTDPNGNVFLTPEPATPGVPVYTEFNILLPNAAGAATGVLGGIGTDGTNARMYVRHNTVCVEGQWALEIGGQSTVESPNRWQQVMGNLCYGSSASGLKVANTRSASTLLDIIPPAVQDYNAGYKLLDHSAAGFTNAGHGYDSKWSVTPGAHDVALDGSGGPRFQNGAATYLTWGQSKDGTITTEAEVTAKVLAGTAGFTTAALLAYIRAAYRPQNAACNAYAGDGTEAFPSDPATTDAAGNPLGGTIGAMAFFNAEATSYTLTTPTTTSGDVTVASGNFTVTPVGGTYTGTITITPSGGGLSTPVVLTFSRSSVPQTFTVTPTLVGTVTLTPTNAGGLTNPSPVTYTALIQLGRVNVQVNTSDNGGVRPTGGTRTPDLGGYVIFPTGPLSEFNRVITSDPVDPNSDAMMGSNPTYGSSTVNIEGYGPDWLAYGFPFCVVDGGTQPLVATSYTPGDGGEPGDEYYPDESDPGPFPIPDNAPVESWTATTPPASQQPDDSHVIVLDRASKKLYELYRAYKIGSTWYAGGGFIFDLQNGGGGYAVGTTSSTSPNLPSLGSLRRTGWTSADAAGLPIFPLLVRYDEAVTRGVIPHALRFTFQNAHTEKTYQWPARHSAGNNPVDPTRLPFGARLRLKSAWYTANAASFTGAARAVVDALRTYGAYNTDIGIDFDLCFVQDDRWDQTNLNTLRSIPASAFEVLQIKPGYSISVSSTTTTVGVPITVTFTRLPANDTNYYTDFYLSEDGGATFIGGPVAVVSGSGSLSMSETNPTVTYTYTPSSAGTKLIQAALDPAGFVPPTSVAVTVSMGGLTAGTVSISGVGSTGAFLNTSSASGGTVPWSYQFQIAPDVGGSPGTWTNTGTAGTAPSVLVTGLSASTTYWVRCVVTDSASATVNSAPVSFATHATRTATTVADGDWTVNATWDNGAPGPGDLAIVHHAVTVTTPAAIGDGSTTVVLSVGNGASGSVAVTGTTLTVLGSMDLGPSYVADNFTTPIDRLTLQSATGAPAGVEFSGNSGVTPVVRVGQYSQIVATGTATDRAFLRTAAASAGNHAYFIGYGPGSHFYAALQYCDLTRLGDITNAGMSNITLSDTGNAFTMDHCRVDSCGALPGISINTGTAVVSLTYSTWTNCLPYIAATPGYAMTFFATVANTSGTRAINHCAFFGTPNFNQAQDLHIDHNYFDAYLQSSHGYPCWASFDDNFVRKADSTETQTNGDVTNSFWLVDATSYEATDGSTFYHVSKYTDTNHAGNVFQYIGSLDSSGCVNPTEAGVNDRTITVRNNIVLPNSAGSTSGTLTTGFNNASDPNQPTTVVEHNTVAIGSSMHGAALLLAFNYVGSPPYAERTDMIASLRANLFWRTGAAPGTGVTAVIQSTTATPLTDSLRAANCDYNAYCALDTVAAGAWLATTGATDCTAGTVYNSPMSGSTPPGVHDVHFGPVADVSVGGPKFVDPIRNLQTWDASLGGPGTKNHALAMLQIQFDPSAAGYDARYTTAALLGYVQGGFTPTNLALHNASYPGDPNPDLGAVPFTAAAIATAYTLTGPATGTSQVASAPFTVIPNASYTGQITPSDGGAKGTFSPTSLVWAGTADSKTFTYTPATAGTYKISATASPSLANPAHVSFSAAKKRPLYLPRPRR